jgi:putative DNA primase/helicase
MGNISDILGNPFTAKDETVLPVDIQVRQAMQAIGIEPPEHIAIDGEIHRFKADSKDKGKAGWYIIYPGTIAAGSFGDWRQGVESNFRADICRELTPAEEMAHAKAIREAKIKRDDDRKRQHETAASTVQHIWDNAASASPDHPYLARKQIQPHNARVTGDGRLVVPLIDDSHKIRSLQYISADGTKRYHKGGETKANFWKMGHAELSENIYLAEGYATAATIYETAHAMTYMSYSASNLPNVAEIITRQYPNHNLIVVADNDKSGTGQNYADQCAAKFGARVVMPPIEGDANDYKSEGHDLMALLKPKIDDWLMPADDFCSQPAPLKWLIKGWLQEESMMMIHGPSGSGKTFVVLDMCLRMASGQPEWMGHKVNPGAVVYLAGEGHHGLRSRIAAWKQEHAPNSKLNMWLSKSGLDLNTREGYQRTSDTISSLPVKPKLIIVDTLHRFLKGNESDPQDTKTMLDQCAKLTEKFGCAVLLVHHTGLSEDAQHRARGSSAWRGALDIEINIAPGKGDDPFRIAQMKSKDTELAESKYAELQQVEINGWYDEDGEPVNSAVVIEGEKPIKESSKEGKHAKHKKLISEAWLAMGKEVVNEKPYISRSALVHHLTENVGLSNSSAALYVRPSADGRLINDLVVGGIIEIKDNGWVIIDNNLMSTLLVQR